MDGSRSSERFDSSGNLIDDAGRLLCDRCGEKVAVVECVECTVPFCVDCKGDVHKKGKWLTHCIRLLQEEKKEDGERKEFLRKSVLEEITTSEKEYVQDLNILIDVYLGPIRTGKFPELTSNKKGDITVVFSTIDLILAGNTELLKELTEEKEKEQPMIGLIFLNKLDNFKLYSVFCNHQEEAMAVITKLEKSSSSFKAFIDGCKEKPEVRRMGFIDFLIKPFQRILKYRLLLKELARYTPEDTEDWPNINDALSKLQIEVDAINQNKAGSDNLKKMLDIHDRIEGLKNFKLLSPTRCFVKEGDLMKISKNKEQERHFFLFNDILVYTVKSKTNKSFTFRGLIELDRMHLVDLADNSSLKNAIQITRLDRNLTYVIYAQTSKEKASWLRELELQKEESISLKNDVDPGAGQFLTRPIWKPDSTAENCVKCNGKFGFLNRKHHCRYCGHIFCAICADYSTDLPDEYGYTEAQRVCVDCYTILTKLSGDAKKRTRTLPEELASQVNEQNPEESYKEGYLVKKGHRRRNWNRRFFVLKKGVLYYFNSQSDAKVALAKMEKSDKPKGEKGCILLKEYTLHTAASDQSIYKFAFILEGKKSFLVRAENQQDLVGWLQVISLLTKSGGELRGSMLR